MGGVGVGVPDEVVQRTVDRLNCMARKCFITAYKSLPDDPVSHPVSRASGWMALDDESRHAVSGSGGREGGLRWLLFACFVPPSTNQTDPSLSETGHERSVFASSSQGRGKSAYKPLLFEVSVVSFCIFKAFYGNLRPSSCESWAPLFRKGRARTRTICKIKHLMAPCMQRGAARRRNISSPLYFVAHDLGALYLYISSSLPSLCPQPSCVPFLSIFFSFFFFLRFSLLFFSSLFSLCFRTLGVPSSPCLSNSNPRRATASFPHTQLRLRRSFRP